MENPLGLLRSQIYRLFNSKSTKNGDGETADLQQLQEKFPWANEAELELIRKEKLDQDPDFTG